jgi:hypothetical protein
MAATQRTATLIRRVGLTTIVECLICDRRARLRCVSKDVVGRMVDRFEREHSCSGLAGV